MWNIPPPNGRAHYLADLESKIEIARTSYRFYIAENVFVFEKSKLDWVERELVKEAFLERNSTALQKIIELHAQLRRQISPQGQDLDALSLLIRFDLELPASDED